MDNCQTLGRKGYGRVLFTGKKNDRFAIFIRKKGDEEKVRGFPVSQCMDRNTSNIYTTQCMFMEYIVLPTARVPIYAHYLLKPKNQVLVEAFPNFSFLVENGNANLELWKSSSTMTSSTSLYSLHTDAK